MWNHVTNRQQWQASCWLNEQGFRCQIQINAIWMVFDFRLYHWHQRNHLFQQIHISGIQAPKHQTEENASTEFIIRNNYFHYINNELQNPMLLQRSKSTDELKGGLPNYQCIFVRCNLHWCLLRLNSESTVPHVNDSTVTVVFLCFSLRKYQ